MTASFQSDLSVLHLNTAKTWRGGEQQVLYLARFLRDAGVRQIVAGRRNSEMQKRCEAEGIAFVGAGMASELDLLSVFRIIRLVRKEPIRVIHAHTAKAHSIGLLAMKLGGLEREGVRFIVSRRVDFRARPGMLSRMKYESPLVHRYVAISENVRRILVEDGIAEDRIRVAYSGIDTERLKDLPDASPLREEFKIPAGTVILGNVAALVDHKDQRTLLQALSLLLERDVPSFLLFIVGEGELREELTALRDRLGLREKVIFTGFRNDVPVFLSLFNIFVMSSKEEGLGTIVLDAMSAGLPVVTTDGGGLPEMIVPEKGGLLSPAQNASALAENIERALRHPDVWKQWGAYNREAVKRFDYRETGRRNLEIYNEVLQS